MHLHSLLFARTADYYLMPLLVVPLLTIRVISLVNFIIPILTRNDKIYNT